MRRLARILIPWLCIVTAAILRADTITLKDGSSVEGDLKRDADTGGWIITTADGKVRNIPNDAVKSVQLGAATSSTSPAAAAESLASLRRSVEAVADLSQIISRYERFISLNSDPQSIAAARADLAEWQKRKDAGLVKHGNQWVTPSQVQQLETEATVLALQARDLIRQNRTKEADAAVQQALAIDPPNASAHYLQGVILFRQDKIADARKAFDAANTAAPNHPPTLNNIAVILWRQNQPQGALKYYDFAMQAAGANEYILNNVAEALGTLPEDQKRGTPVPAALRRFTELDLILQQKMAQQGMYRWGGGWVDQKQLDDLKAAEKEIRQKLEALQADFEQTKQRIVQIDQEISRNESSMDDLRARSVWRDASGRYVTMPLPTVYYDLERQNQQLRAEQDSLQSKASSMPEQARRLQQQVPVPKFTGVQQIVGVEGMPGSFAAPSTRQTTP